MNSIIHGCGSYLDFWVIAKVYPDPKYVRSRPQPEVFMEYIIVFRSKLGLPQNATPAGQLFRSACMCMILCGLKTRLRLKIHLNRKMRKNEFGYCMCFELLSISALLSQASLNIVCCLLQNPMVWIKQAKRLRQETPNRNGLKGTFSIQYLFSFSATGALKYKKENVFSKDLL